MNDKKYKGISGATVVVFIAVIFFVLWMTSRVQMRGQEITFTQFEQEIKDDNVTEVVINQNKAVPTGVVTLTLRDSRETGRVNVSDVNETQKLLDKNDVELPPFCMIDPKCFHRIIIDLPAERCSKFSADKRPRTVISGFSK